LTYDTSKIELYQTALRYGYRELMLMGTTTEFNGIIYPYKHLFVNRAKGATCTSGGFTAV